MTTRAFDSIRDAPWRLISRLQRPAAADYRWLLQDYSRTLTSLASLPRLLETIADQIDQVFQPESVAIVLAEHDLGYRVFWSQGFTAESLWQEGNTLSPDHPLAQRLAAQRHPLALASCAPGHIAETDLLQSAPDRSGACLFAPMHMRGTLMGWVALGRRRSKRGYTRRDLEFLSVFVDQSCVVLENARLYAAATRERDQARQLYERTDAALRFHVEELTVIEEVSRQLTSTLELDKVLDLLLRYALQATDADRGVIALYLPQERSLRLMTQQGYPPELDRYRTEPWPVERGITGRVARTRHAVLAPDVSQDPDYALVVPTTRSQLSVPILHQGKLTGVITLESDRLAAFRDENLRFAELLADHAAIAIYNAQLFEQVVEGRERLQAILHSIHDAVIVWDMEGRVTLVNPRLTAVLGPNAERWLRSLSLKEVDRVLEDSDLQKAGVDVTALAQLLREVYEQPDQVRSSTFSFRTEQGMCYVKGTSAPVRNAKGQVIGILTVLRDITHQKEVDRFRAEMTSMIVHNLQGPLAAILSSLEMLQEDPQLDGETRSELLQIALSSGRKLYERIESLLWIRRLEDKQIPLELYTLSLPQVVQPVVEEYTPLALRSGVQLEAFYAPDLPPVVVDEEVIGRVVSNLLDNALKFTPEGGCIRVEVRRSPDRESELLCSVADSGVGIPAHLQQAIFDRFRQGAIQGRRRGMGLGLYYCTVAVEAHGGRIWVESQPGEGSTFFFTLPQA